MLTQNRSTCLNPPETLAPIVIGIIGGIASGKSEVTKILVGLGAFAIHADKIGHELLEDFEIKSLLQERFGSEIFDSAGNVIRSELAKIVFQTTSKENSSKTELESILHPRIRKLAEEQIEAIKKSGSKRLIVVDAPLLIEAQWNSICNKILFVDTPDAMRIHFAASRGWNQEELQRREQNQLSLDIKKRYATDIIINDGSVQLLEARIKALPWLPLA